MSGLSVVLELAGLGLAAVDPIGLAFMPILLAQPRGTFRAFIFMFGSFVALTVLGLVFTTGFGSGVLAFNERYPWAAPTVETLGGIALFLIGLYMLRHARRAESSLAPESLIKRLELPVPLLLLFGAVLVTVQSLVDVVFIVAMVEAGTEDLSLTEKVVAVLAYAIGALLLQMLVIVGYWLIAADQRKQAMDRFTEWLNHHGETATGWISLVLGSVLTVVSLLHVIDIVG
jgi:Sap, sulfolipid-1-addressing protein